MTRTRLQTFRSYMARMNLTDPGSALNAGLYVHPPGRSLADRLVSGFEIDLVSTGVVVGGVGSGKTTELLRTVVLLQEKFREAGTKGDAWYIDLLHEGYKLDQIQAGTLITSVVEELCLRASQLPKNKRNPIVESAALGGSPKHVRLLKDIVLGVDARLVVAFDSLDRLASPEHFARVVRDDLHALKEIGVGVVIVAPNRLTVGNSRAVLDVFDKKIFQLAINPETADGASFLAKVLRARADTDILPDDGVMLLAKASGGVLRDLIALAKGAGEAAYVAGHNSIQSEDVRQAIDEFGRTLAVGLDARQVKWLANLYDGRIGFVITAETEILFETRRVLLYEGNRWVVHPALAPHLEAMYDPGVPAGLEP